MINLALVKAAPETAAEHDRLRKVNARLLRALRLAAQYLGKAVADDLMSECVRPPKFALRIAEETIKEAQP